MNIDKFGRGTYPGRLSAPVDSAFARKGFPRTATGDYDVENLKLQNVGVPISPKDGSTKQYVDEVIETMKQQQDTLVKRMKVLEEKNKKLEKHFLKHVTHIEQVILELTSKSNNETIISLNQSTKLALEDTRELAEENRDSQVL